MKKILGIVLAFYLWAGSSSHALEAGFVEALTANLPPYSIYDAENSGLFVEICKEIERKLGEPIPLRFLPWARTQYLAQSQSNKIIFPLSRVAEREDLYDWLIDVAPIHFVFVTKGGHALALEEAKHLPWISVQKETPFEYFLIKNGFRNIVSSPHPTEVHLKLLQNERVDAWFTSAALARDAFKGQSIDGYTLSPPVQSARLYIATSKDFPAETAKRMREAFDQLRKDGVISDILKRYGME